MMVMTHYDELSGDELEHALGLHRDSIVIDCSAVIRMDQDYYTRMREGGGDMPESYGDRC
jgi:hypothetical protein